MSKTTMTGFDSLKTDLHQWDFDDPDASIIDAIASDVAEDIRNAISAASFTFARAGASLLVSELETSFSKERPVTLLYGAEPEIEIYLFDEVIVKIPLADLLALDPCDAYPTAENVDSLSGDEQEALAKRQFVRFLRSSADDIEATLPTTPSEH